MLLLSLGVVPDMCLNDIISPFGKALITNCISNSEELLTDKSFMPNIYIMIPNIKSLYIVYSMMVKCFVIVPI